MINDIVNILQLFYEQLYAATLLKLKGSREETVSIGSDKEGGIYVNS